MNSGIKWYLPYIQWTAIVCFIFMLISCSTVHPTHQTSIQQSISTLQESIKEDKGRAYSNWRTASYHHRRLPSDVENALLPPLSHYINQTRDEQPRFDVTANKIPAKEFFVGLFAGTQENVVVNPNVEGMVSLNLKNVTIEQTLDAVRDIYGYEYHHTTYGYEILEPRLESQIFHINYLDVRRAGRSYMQLTTGQVSNTVTSSPGGGTTTTTPVNIPQSQTLGAPQGIGTISSVETKSEMQFWKDIEKAIQGMIARDGAHSVTVNAQAGIVAVHAYPVELHRVARYINSLQSSLNRQVVLEAKILEVQLNDSFQSGLDWSILNNPAYAELNQTGNNSAGMGQAANSPFTNSLFSDESLPPLNGIFAVKVNGNFKILINLLQTQGNVQVLSSPHISTVNNQKAVIKVGSDEFFVTGVSTSNTIIGTNTLPSQDVSLTPFFSGVTLDVTPEISSNDDVVLHIHPSVSQVTQQTKVIGLGTNAQNSANNLTLPLAFSTIRESDNIVHAKNGQVIVIGGLMQNIMNETIIETPWVSKIPFLGALFRRTQQVAAKSELVILLRPVVSNNRTTIEALNNEKKTFTILRRPFHAGGLPKVFGNEAEKEDTN